MSFSTGGLFYTESLLIVDEYFSTHDWSLTRKSALEKNSIQSRTESSVKRRVREICSRLELLSLQQLTLIQNGSRSEQQYLLWLAICKRHPFIQEFAVEVIREKFLRMDLLISDQEYNIFFEKKASWHNELDQLQKSTRIKLRQVLFKILREAEIISDTFMIIPALLTAELVQAITTEDPQLLRVFPISDMDIQTWLK
jgi:hypothetical protein